MRRWNPLQDTLPCSFCRSDVTLQGTISRGSCAAGGCRLSGLHLLAADGRPDGAQQAASLRLRTHSAWLSPPRTSSCCWPSCRNAPAPLTQDCIGLLRAACCSSAQIWMVPCGQSFKGFSQKFSTNTMPLDHLIMERTQAESLATVATAASAAGCTCSRIKQSCGQFSDHDVSCSVCAVVQNAAAAAGQQAI